MSFQKRVIVCHLYMYVKGKVCLRASGPSVSALNSGFFSMKQLGISLHPSLDGMLVHHKVTPSIMISGTHSYTWVKRDNVEYSFSSKETTQRQRPGSNHRPPDRKSSVLTTRPPRLHSGRHYVTQHEKKHSSSIFCLFSQC